MPLSVLMNVIVRTVLVFGILCIAVSTLVLVAANANGQDVDCGDLSYAERIGAQCDGGNAERQTSEIDCNALSYAERIAAGCLSQPFGLNGTDEGRAPSDPRGDVGSPTLPVATGIAALLAAGGAFFTASRRVNMESAPFS